MLTDLNYVEDSAGGPDVTVGFLPKLDKVTLLQVVLYSFHLSCSSLFIYFVCVCVCKVIG